MIHEMFYGACNVLHITYLIIIKGLPHVFYKVSFPTSS